MFGTQVTLCWAHAEIVECSFSTVLAGFFLGIIAIVASTIPCCIMCCCAKGPQVCRPIPVAYRLTLWLRCCVLLSFPSSQTHLQPVVRLQVCQIIAFVWATKGFGCYAVYSVQHGGFSRCYSIQPTGSNPVHWTACCGCHSLRGTVRA